MFLAAFFLLYAGLGISGYGNDNDTYGMLKTWSDLVRHGLYSPSRSPGYPLPELAIGAAARAGGWIASNAVSALLACGCLELFRRLLAFRLGPRTALLAAIAAGLNPYFIIAASSSMDYVYAAFFFLAGLSALASGRFLLSGPLFALCAASRLTYAPLIVLAYAAAALLFCAPSLPSFLPFARSGGASAGGALPFPAAAALRRMAIGAALFLVFGIAAYLPSWFSMGPAMFKPTLSDAPVSLVGLDGFPTLAAYAARFVYKNISLWGLPAFILLAAAAALGLFRCIRGSRLFRLSRPPRPLRKAPDPIPWAAAAGLLYAELLFFRLPLEINYLLPVLFLGIFLMGRAPGARAFLILIALGHALQAVAQVDFIEKTYARRSYESVEASGGRVRLHVDRGVVWQDVEARRDSQAHYLKAILGD